MGKRGLAATMNQHLRTRGVKLPLLLSSLIIINGIHVGLDQWKGYIQCNSPQFPQRHGLNLYRIRGEPLSIKGNTA
jgi:hypothetical protein